MTAQGGATVSSSILPVRPHPVLALRQLLSPPRGPLPHFLVFRRVQQVSGRVGDCWEGRKAGLEEAEEQNLKKEVEECGKNSLQNCGFGPSWSTQAFHRLYRHRHLARQESPRTRTLPTCP
ncbi:hypothetical protein C0Q70_19979 [Pomacea canaliculata]|uniref:Uncharacterized protein n=1 Tax=Pomacea canaliculata TaxID=400727 RepID=A0A2T7NE86_POMCA|nr:hypothetical protein C0Q70_19979 [Pomacea canaliculata]